MNNKKIFLRKTAFVCLIVTVSACDDFEPANTSDVVARWTADSLALRDGDQVSLWPDSSLNGQDAMATASSRPTYRIVNGVPMVHFDGIDDYLIAGATDWRFLKDGSEWTVLVVFRSSADKLGGEHVLLDTDGEDAGFTVSYANRSDASSNDAVRLSVDADTGAYDVDLGGSNRGYPPGKWGIISATFKKVPYSPEALDSPARPPSGSRTRGEATLFVNGYRRTSSETWVQPRHSRGAVKLNIGRHGTGNAFPTKGDIREIVIYRRALTQQEHYEATRRLSGKVAPAVRIRTPLSQKWLSVNPNGYQGFGIAFRIPSTGKLVAIQRQGAAHLGGPIGEVRQWESTDHGVTWTNKLMYDSEFDDRNVGGGLASKTGTILAFISRIDGVNSIDMRALRSVDDAQTFSDIGAPLPTNGYSWYSPYGPMVELPSGRLLQTFYGGIGRTSKVWISESVDDGLTWTYKAEIYGGTLVVNETSLAWIDGADDATSTLVAISRNDRGAGLLQFVSRDGGNTWTNQGVIPGGNLADVSPWLHRLSDGTLVNAWHERTWFSFAIRIGAANDVAASPSNWSQPRGTYQAATRVVGDSGYPALLSATGWDEDLIQVLYDRVPGGNANLMINPISLP